MSRSFWTFLYSQWMPLPSVASFAQDLTGRTVLLTGGNTGLGFEAAKHLASMNPARLIITSRDEQRAQAAVEEIQKASKGAATKVECWELDQAKFASVHAFVERFAKEGGGRLDILILNAGLVQMSHTETTDGWELMLQVNHLATSLLALRLLPYLLAAPASPPSPRLVILNSGLHHYIPDVPEAEAESMLRTLSAPEYCAQPGKMRVRYVVTKLFNVLFTRTLSSRLPKSTTLTANTVNPGFCHSSLARSFSSLAFSLRKALLARRTEMGSRTLVHAAVAPDVQGKSGEYLDNCAVAEPSTLVMSERGKEVGDKLWTDTIEQLTLVDPEVPRIIKQYLS